MRLSGLRNGWIAAMLGALALTSPSPARPAAPSPPRLLWAGKSGGFAWRWTTADLSASRGERAARVLSLKQREGKDFDPEGYTSFDCSVRPLSLVGSILSYRRDLYWEGGAHPSGDIAYTAVDPSRPRRNLTLTDLFPDREVLRALLADPVVRGALEKDASPPKSAVELAERLKGKTFGGEEGATYGFPTDLLSGFAFHHLEGDKVAVRLGVGWGAEIYRFRSTEIGILLPIPAPLRRPLALAAAGREGFLMKDAKRRFGDKSATLLTYERKGR